MIKMAIVGLAIGMLAVASPGLHAGEQLMSRFITYDAFPLGEQQFVSDGGHPFVAVSLPDVNLTEFPSPVLQGSVPTYNFDGARGFLSPDSDDWYELSGRFGPLCGGAWVLPYDRLGKYNLMAQYDASGPRFFTLQFEGGGNVIVAVRDQSTGAVLKPRMAWPTDSSWHHLGFCFWEDYGTGRFYAQVLVDGFAGGTVYLSPPTFTGVQNVPLPFTVGYFHNYGIPIEAYRGLIAGGECAAFLFHKRPTDREWIEYVAECRSLLAL